MMQLKLTETEGRILMIRFKLFYYEFPASIHGKARACVLLKGDHAVIIIDSLLPKDQQERSLKHELAHLWLNHLFRPVPDDADIYKGHIDSDKWEAEADRYAEAMTQEEYEALMQWAI